MTYQEFREMADREIERLTETGRHMYAAFSIQLTDTDRAMIENFYQDNGYGIEFLKCPQCKRNLADIIIRW